MTTQSFLKPFVKLSVCLTIGLAFCLPGCNDPDPPPVATKSGKKPYKGKNVQIALGGGGNANAGDYKNDAKKKSDSSNTSSNSSSPGMTTVANIEGGLANGLFPQASASFSQTGFGGGLVPDLQNPGDGGNADSGDSGLADSGNRFGVPNQQDDAEEVSSVSTGPRSMLDMAQNAFRNRNENDGFKYLYAHMLSDPDAPTNFPIGWYQGIKQPKVALRFGVGVTYVAPRTFEGKPPVIGDPEDVRLPGVANSNRSSSSGRGRGIGPSGGGGGGAIVGTEDSPYANVDTSTAEGFLLYYTGDFGDRLLTKLEERRTSNDAYFGLLLKELGMEYLQEAQQPAAATSSNRPRNTSSRGRSIGPSGGGGGTGRNIGPAGGGGGAPRGNRNRGGNSGVIGSGSSGPSRSTGPTSDRLTRVSGGSAASDPDGSLTGTLVPGVMLIGEGKNKELIERAKEMGLDALFVFSTRVSSGRKATGTTAVKLINVHTGKEVFKSRSLNSEKVAKARDRNKNSKTDPVAMAVEGIFKESLDKDFRAKPMPALKPEHVISRVKNVLKDETMDPMAAAVEVVAFQRMDLLEVDAATTALDKLLGEGAGDAILAGNADARDAILKNYLPEDAFADEGF